MTEFSWWQILLTLFAAVGGVKGAEKLLALAADRYDKFKQNRKELKAQHDSLTIESRKLELDEDKQNVAERGAILEFYKDRVKELEARVIELELGGRIARQVSRKVRRHLDTLKIMIERKEKPEILKAQMDVVENDFDELENNLP